MSDGIVLTPKQKELLKTAASYTTTLAEGGSRSGKTLAWLYAILKRACEHESKHLVARYRFAHAKQAICHETMPVLFDGLGLRGAAKLNKTDWFYELPNGSTIWIGGLDEKERTEKILGNEYATILLNEASQIGYDTYETIVTRLNPPSTMAGRIFIDYNPPSIKHWGYKIFHERQFPDGRAVPDGDYARVKLNPNDNPHLSEEYVERLKQLSPGKRKRFLAGEYAKDEGALWRREWISYGEPPATLHRVVIGVDPAGSVGGDEIGIVVAAESDGVYYVLDDVSLHGTPTEWARAVANVYNRWSADVVAAERNYGGDMVKHTIQSVDRSVNVRMVTATRGKAVRAEPISSMYEQGKVLHREPFPELEDEMCMYEPGSDVSPNRLDAAVWALTELTSRGAVKSTFAAGSLGL